MSVSSEYYNPADHSLDALSNIPNTDRTNSIGGKGKPDTSDKGKLVNLGFHVERGTDMLARLDWYSSQGFDCFQIFVNNPRQMLNMPSGKTFAVIDELGIYVKEYGVKVFIHSPYTINLSNAYLRTAYWNTALIQELEMGERISSAGVVVHTGKYKEQDKDIGIANMVANLSYAIQIAKSNVPLLIETPAGQGTELGVTIEELADIWTAIPAEIRSRVGICIDTCHVFAAGYDITDPVFVKQWLAKFDKLIGLKNLKLVHLNDSRMPLASHLDRHARLLEGVMGDKLGVFVREIYKLGVPIIVETPGDFTSDLMALSKWIA